MKNVLKRAISVLLVAVMVFGSSPFAGGLPELNLFSAKAEAAEAEEIITIPENELEWSTDENGNVVIRAYIVGSSGNTITSDGLNPIYDSQYLYSEVTFWQVIFNFIKRLFGKTDTVSQFFTDIM